MSKEILVFVPGIQGSELWDGDERIWPGSLFDAIGGFSETEFQRLLQPGLEPRDLVRQAVGGLVGIYRPWIKAFEGIRRNGTQLFAENPVGGLPKTLHVFPYDWRVDLRGTAKVFADFLDKIAKNDVNLKLVCHSMGGLVARYYLESGQFNTREAFAKISLLLTFGTPHNGAPKAFAAAVGLDKANFLSNAQTRRMANDPRYPSAFQLFPAREQSFIWHSKPQAAFRNYAPDDTELVERYKLDPENLLAWSEFRSGLGKKPASVRYFYVVGSTQETLVRLQWTGEDLLRLELDDSGDGTVPLQGAMESNVQTDFVGKSHVSLIETKQARQTLAALFAGESVFAAQLIDQVTLSVRDVVVTTDDEIQVQITFDPELDTFKGVLRFQRADVPEDGNTENLNYINFHSAGAVPVELRSAGVAYINLKTKPLNVRGVYRPVLIREDDSIVVGPEFAVQMPTE